MAPAMLAPGKNIGEATKAIINVVAPAVGASRDVLDELCGSRATSS